MGGIRLMAHLEEFDKLNVWYRVKMEKFKHFILNIDCFKFYDN